MRALFPMLAAISSFFVCGCAEKGESPPKQGLEIHAPGVDVEIDREHGVHVKAGETEVNANKGQGVNVRAPGVEVEAQPGKAGDGVKLQKESE